MKSFNLPCFHQVLCNGPWKAGSVYWRRRLEPGRSRLICVAGVSWSLEPHCCLTAPKTATTDFLCVHTHTLHYAEMNVLHSQGWRRSLTRCGWAGVVAALPILAVYTGNPCWTLLTLFVPFLTTSILSHCHFFILPFHIFSTNFIIVF